jgi:hypothetical protein
VKGTIPKKHTFFGSKIKFLIIVRAKVRPTRATKHTEKGVVGCFTKKTLKWSLHIDDTTRKPINEKTCCGKSIAPETKGNGGMGK